MAKTDAERQRECRQRRARRIAALEASAAEREVIVAGLTAQLQAALAESERLAAMVCRHPAGAVEAGRCHACGATDVW